MNNSRFPYSQPRFFPPVIKWLVILNVGIFVLGMPNIGVDSNGDTITLYHVFFKYGALWPPSSPFFRPWQYLTTMFLHAPDFFHVGINMFVLWMFGIEIENTWGSKRFLIFYLLSGLGASALHTLITVIDGSTSAAVGASGAIAGVMIAFAALFPNRLILLFFFFPMKAKWAAAFYIAYSLFSGISNSPLDNVAHFAHLGGALTGFILYKTGLHTIIANKLFGGTSNKHVNQVQPPRPPGPFSRADRRESARIVDARFRDVPAPPPRSAPIRMNFGEDQERIDQILDKISDEGYQSLTQEEKDLLNEASKKMGR